MKSQLLENYRMPISNKELERRWSATKQSMIEQGIDCLVIQNSEQHFGGYTRWFTDIPAILGTPMTVIFPVDDEMTVISEGNTPDMKMPGWLLRGVKDNIVRPYYRSLHYTDQLDGQAAVEVLKKMKPKKVGIVAKGLMSASFYEYLVDSLSTEMTFVNATDLVDDIKCIKSDEEIGLIKKTTAIIDAAFGASLSLVRPGRKEYEVAADLRSLLIKMGSEEQLIMVCSEPAGQPAGHKAPFLMNRTLQKGDQVMIMLEVNGPGGFYAEVGRTICIGEPPKPLLKAWDVAKDAQQRAAELLKDGARPGDVCRINDDYMASKGYPANGLIFAHGQGYELAERPVIYEPEPMLIRPNMNIAVHPFGVNNKAYAFCCDNYLTGIDGAVRLTNTKTEILVAEESPW